MLFLEGAQRGRQQVDADSGAGADAERAPLDAAHLLEGGVPLVEHVEHPPCVAVEAGPRLGQPDALAEAVEQRKAERLLELFDLIGDGRLAELQPLRRGRKAGQVGNRFERPELSQRDRAVQVELKVGRGHAPTICAWPRGNRDPSRRFGEPLPASKESRRLSFPPPPFPSRRSISTASAATRRCTHRRTPPTSGALPARPPRATASRCCSTRPRSWSSTCSPRTARMALAWRNARSRATAWSPASARSTAARSRCTRMTPRSSAARWAR